MKPSEDYELARLKQAQEKQKQLEYLRYLEFFNGHIRSKLTFKNISIAIPVVGFLIFSNYFNFIGYFPELNFQASTALIASAALTSFSFSISFLALLVMPGLMINFFTKIGKNNNDEGDNISRKKDKVIFFRSAFVVLMFLLLMLATLATTYLSFTNYKLISTDQFGFYRTHLTSYGLEL
jgi:hypothetical protein